MANINELEGLGLDAGFEVDYEDVPEQFGGFTPIPPPGTYRFRLPGDLSNVWEQFDATINEKKVKRLRANFEGTVALEITQSKSGEQTGDSFRCRISNAERKRDKEGRMASDMLYLLRALGDTAVYKSNLEYANALMKYAGREFIATVEWSAWCSDQRAIRVYNEAGEIITNEQQMGCGHRVYQRDIPKLEAGGYADEFACPECGAILRPFANLVQFQPLQVDR